jgi:hypothetical protein
VGGLTVARNEEKHTHSQSTPLTKPRRRKRNLRWKSLIEPFEAGEYQVIPLVCSDDLREEGELMNHCVGRKYDRWCHVDVVRVFSIRDLAGRRLATASLYFSFKELRWRFEQCKGYNNREVCQVPVVNGDEQLGVELSDMHFVVQYLLTHYQRAHERFNNYELN